MIEYSAGSHHTLLTLHLLHIQQEYRCGVAGSKHTKPTLRLCTTSAATVSMALANAYVNMPPRAISTQLLLSFVRPHATALIPQSFAGSH